MKRLQTSMVVFFSTALLSSCGGGSSPEPSGSADSTPQTGGVASTCTSNRTATQMVTYAGDAPVHSGLSLRDALQFSNTSGNHIIQFDEALNGISLSLEQGPLTITRSVIIQGNGALATTLDAQGKNRIFEVSGDTTDVTLDCLSLTNGRSTGHIAPGGAILFNSLGTLTVSSSSVYGNSTTNTGSSGGAIHSGRATIQIIDSSFHQNFTEGDIASGGAINLGIGTLSISNSTFTQNGTKGDQSFGGAISSVFGNVQLDSVTIARNSTNGTSSSAGGLYVKNGSLEVSNSIIALNTIVSGGYPDIFTDFSIPVPVTFHYSLLGNRQGTLLLPAPIGSPDTNGNLVGTPAAPIDPKLESLDLNGGVTKTLALQSNSPAVNKTGITTLLYDQRGPGYSRTVNALDMGAYERQ